MILRSVDAGADPYAQYVHAVPVVIQAAQRFVRCFADAVEGIRSRKQVVRHEPLGVRMEANRVVTASQDHPRHASASGRFQHRVSTVDVGVQDPAPLGLRGDSTEMNDGIDVLRGVSYRVEISDIRRYRLDPFPRLRVRYRRDVEQPQETLWPGHPGPQHRTDGAGRSGDEYAFGHVLVPMCSSRSGSVGSGRLT